MCGGGYGPATHAEEKRDKVALSSVSNFGFAEIKSDTCSSIKRGHLHLVFYLFPVREMFFCFFLPVLSWLFWLVAGLTAWTGWLSTRVDLWLWPGPLPLAGPVVVLVTAPRPRRRPLLERRRLPLPPACAAVRACSASSAALPLKLPDLPNWGSK